MHFKKILHNYYFPFTRGAVKMIYHGELFALALCHLISDDNPSK